MNFFLKFGTKLMEMICLYNINNLKIIVKCYLTVVSKGSPYFTLSPDCTLNLKIEWASKSCTNKMCTILLLLVICTVSWELECIVNNSHFSILNMNSSHYSTQSFSFISLNRIFYTTRVHWLLRWHIFGHNLNTI